MRRLRRARGGAEGAGRAADSQPPGGDGKRHWLLLQLPRLHQHLWHAHAAWALAAGGQRPEAGQPRADCARHRRRRRRLRHRLRPLRPRHAPQHQPDLHGAGQPDLRPDHRTDVAHQPHWNEDQVESLRQLRYPGQPAHARAFVGRHLRRTRLLRRPEAPDGTHQAGHPAQRLLVPRHIQPVRHLQQGQYLPVVPSARKEARRQCGVRLNQLDRRHGKGDSVGR